MGSIKTQVGLVNVTRDFLDLEAQGYLRNQLSRIYMEEGEHMFQDITLDQAPEFAKVLSFLCQDNPLSAKLQTYYYNSLKKHLSKKTVKSLSFEEQYNMLDVLPPADLALEHYASSKSSHYILLNEMLTPSNQLAENWDTLDKHQVIRVAERCKEMAKCRDINNKLRGALLHIRTHTFSIEDYKKLFLILSESGVGSAEK